MKLSCIIERKKKEMALSECIYCFFNDSIPCLQNNNFSYIFLGRVEVLKHSALLSVRAKFDNIVALNTIALTRCKKLSQISSVAPKASLHCSASPEDSIIAMKQLYCNSSDKSKTLTSLEALLDSDVGWKSMVPKWIGKRINELGFQLPKLNTFREFLWEIRCLYEHENKYNPPEV